MKNLYYKLIAISLMFLCVVSQLILFVKKFSWENAEIGFVGINLGLAITLFFIVVVKAFSEKNKPNVYTTADIVHDSLQNELTGDERWVNINE